MLVFWGSSIQKSEWHDAKKIEISTKIVVWFIDVVVLHLLPHYFLQATKTHSLRNTEHYEMDIINNWVIMLCTITLVALNKTVLL